MKITAFSEIAPCSLVEVYFRGALTKEAVCTAEMLVYYNKTKWSYIPEDCNLHTHCLENLKSHQEARNFNWNAVLLFHWPLIVLSTCTFCIGPVGIKRALHQSVLCESVSCFCLKVYVTFMWTSNKCNSLCLTQLQNASVTLIHWFCSCVVHSVHDIFCHSVGSACDCLVCF
jgi:hypothetical protein